MPAFCTSCGAATGGRRFCTSCGTDLADVGPGAPAPTTQQPAVAPDAWPVPTPRARGHRRGRVALVVALALVASGGLGAGAVWLLGDRDETTRVAQTGSNPEPAPEVDQGDEVATESASPVETSPEPSPTDDAVADPLGLGSELVNQQCTGEYLVMLASSGDPTEWIPTLAPALRAAPDASYLVTDESCGSFVQDIDGQRIYAAYVGPFPDLEGACGALASTGVAGGYARHLDLAVTSRSVCSCLDTAQRPRLSRALDAEPIVFERQLAVSDVQVLLDRAGLNTQRAYGGSFGPSTQGWVRELQRGAGLRASGVVDGATWAELLTWCDES